MKILSLLKKPIQEAKAPETKEELKAANRAGAKEDLERNRDALTKAIYDGNDELADEIRDVIKGLEQELKESEDKDALKKRLASLKKEYAKLPKNPSNQEGYDALDDYREEIKKLEQQLNEEFEQEVASDKYAEYSGQIQELLNALQAKLDEHAEQAGAEADNWGYAGDLEEVVNKLKEAVALFGGIEDATD